MVRTNFEPLLLEGYAVSGNTRASINPVIFANGCVSLKLPAHGMAWIKFAYRGMDPVNLSLEVEDLVCYRSEILFCPVGLDSRLTPI